MRTDGSRQQLLRLWDDFVDSRSLPYFRDDHQLMLRQVLDRYPIGKLDDLSDRDLLECVNLDSGPENPRLKRSFRFFIGHFDQFLERAGLK